MSKLGLSHKFVAPRWRNLNPARGAYRFDYYRSYFDAPPRIRNHYMVIKTPEWAADRSYIDRDLGLILGMEKDGPRVHLATKGRMENPGLAAKVVLRVILEPHNIPFPDVTYYELAVPWSLFDGFKPAVDSRLRFNIVFNDSEDGAESKAPSPSPPVSPPASSAKADP